MHFVLSQINRYQSNFLEKKEYDSLHFSNAFNKIVNLREELLLRAKINVCQYLNANKIMAEDGLNYINFVDSLTKKDLTDLQYAFVVYQATQYCQKIKIYDEGKIVEKQLSDFLSRQVDTLAKQPEGKYKLNMLNRIIDQFAIDLSQNEYENQ